MIIANPIYDVVFKRLMENEHVAKFLIGTLINQNILSIQVNPQEFTYSDKITGIAVFRLDFIAVIQTPDGGSKKILIEIQKAKNQIDLMRFRSYLAEQYKKKDEVDGIKEILPITTIYILGFKISEINSSCFHVQRQYKDLITNKTIKEKSYFVERLTHDSFVVQVQRIGQRYQTKLDKLLSIFEQRNFTDSSEITKEYTYDIDEEAMKTITNILHHAGTNPEERKAIEIEREAWRSVNALFENKEKQYLDTIREKDKTIDQKDKALNEKDKLIEELKKKLKDK